MRGGYVQREAQIISEARQGTMKHVKYRQLSDLSNVQIMELLFKKITLFGCSVRRAPILVSTFYSWIEENKMDFNQIAITILKLRQELSAYLSLVDSTSESRQTITILFWNGYLTRWQPLPML